MAAVPPAASAGGDVSRLWRGLAESCTASLLLETHGLGNSQKATEEEEASASAIFSTWLPNIEMHRFIWVVCLFAA